MRITSLSWIAAILLATSPLAFAANTPSSSSSSMGKTGTSSQSSTSTSGDTASQKGGSSAAQVRDQLQQSLEKSGFKDVRIAAESYAVSATAPDGSHVYMTISPGSIEGISVHAPQSQGSNSTSQQ